MSSTPAAVVATVPAVATASWLELIQQLKSSDAAAATNRVATLRQVQERLPSPPQQIDAAAQQPLLNALMHLLHDRGGGASNAAAEESAPALALACISRLFAQPTILTPERFRVLQKKTHELWQRSNEVQQLFRQSRTRIRTVGAPTFFIAACAHFAIDAVGSSIVAQSNSSAVILDAFKKLPTENATDSAASSSAAPSDPAAAAAAALRKEKRQLKEARIQAQAAQRRTEKAMAVASNAPNAAAVAVQKVSSTATAVDAVDHGVEDGTESAPFGNFHTYYAFNPPRERLQYVPPQLAAYILQAEAARVGNAPKAFSFLDVGCNEGDLTIGLMHHLLTGLRGDANDPPIPVAAAVAASSSSAAAASAPSAVASVTAALDAFAFTPVTPVTALSFSDIQMHAIGVDIDALLIDRARTKIVKGIAAAAPIAAQPASPQPTLQFAAIDVMQADALDAIRAMRSHADGLSTNATPSAATSASAAVGASSSSQPTFSLVCCYSITMWVHLHHGDAGLRHFLSSLASLTSHLIIEPQPWQCYKNARERWRRKGKEDPPAMVGLSWRTQVEEEIVTFLTQQCGMRVRAELGSTKWKRRVIWFERTN